MIKQTVKVMLAGVFLLLVSNVSAQKKSKDNLSGKIYKITVTESKKGKSGKPAADEMEFRSGKLKCNTIMDQFGFGQIKYELEKDSTYSEEGDKTETLYIELEAIVKDKDDQEVKVVATIDGYGIEGYFELLDKKGKVKKHYDFVGGEKGPKKAPKESKKKKKEGEEESEE